MYRYCRRVFTVIGHAPLVRLGLLGALLLAGALVPAGPLRGSAQAASSGPITYAYDQAGRLTGVIDPSQTNAGVYHYDAAGNITAISHQSTSQVSILGVAPLQGAVGSAVTITGTGFSSTASNDTVQFHGTTASVSSAGPTQLVVTVPNGATTGTISVSVVGVGSATSASSFGVGAPAGPTIASVSTSIATAGTSVTINGSGFDPNAAHAIVRFNGTIGQVTTTATTSLTVTVPPATGSGKLSVTTPNGTTTGSDFFIPPSPYSASQVGTTGRIPANQAQTLTFGTAGQIGIFAFDGTQGQRVSLQLANDSTLYYNISIYSPDGVNLTGTNGCGPTNCFVPAVTLPITGTYALLVDPGTSTGSVSLTLNQFKDISATITENNTTPLTVTVSYPGQRAFVTFTGTAGQRASLRLSNPTIGSGEVYLLTRWNATLGSANFGCCGAFIDAVTLPVTGTYTIEITPDHYLGVGYTGSVSLSLYAFNDIHGTITPSGAPPGTPASVTYASPGQDAYLTFKGTAGQRASIQINSSSVPDYSVSLRAPDGSTLETGGGYLDAITLPTTGTYTVFVDALYGETGSIALTLYAFSDVHATITPNSTSPLTVTTPGQNAYVTWTGTAGDDATLQLSNATLGGFTVGPYTVTIRDPNGNVLASQSFGTGNGSIGPFAESLSRTYTIFIDPSGPDTGSVQLSLSQQPSPVKPKVSPTPTASPGAATPQPLAMAPVVGHLVQQGEKTMAQERDSPLGSDRAHDRQQRTDAQHAGGALLGQVRTEDGAPLAHVTLTMGRHRTETSRWGDFLLTGLSPGHQILLVEGSTANRPGATYGLFPIRVRIRAHQVTALPYVIWMPKLDTAHEMTVASPTRHRVVLSTPRIPGLEIILPKGAVVRDYFGKVVHRLGITPIPGARPPFPLPRGQFFPVYFTVQPGGATVSPGKVRVIYPNADHSRPGTRMPFWGYEPEWGGWRIYGYGHVTKDSTSVVPGRKVYFYEFTGAGNPADGGPPPSGCGSNQCCQGSPPPGPPPPPPSEGGGGSGPGGGSLQPPDGGACGGDPVDLSTGLLVEAHTDLHLGDVIPIDITRVWRQGDVHDRWFGIGQNFTYGMFLSVQYGTSGYQQINLVLPNGGEVPYFRISPGSDETSAVLQNTTDPGLFYHSRLTWNGDLQLWQLRLRTGMVYQFADLGALSGSGSNGLLVGIQDRVGNTLRVIYGSSPLISAIKSPNGRWVEFSYTPATPSGEPVISQVQDDLGRTVRYTYFSSGVLQSVTDAKGGVTSYTCDCANGQSSNDILTVTDPRGITSLSVSYDSANRVAKETLADGSSYQYAYTTNGSGQITQTAVTDRRGYVRQVTFDANGDVTSDTLAVGTPQQEAYTFGRQAGTELMTSITDQLGRQTALGYDAYGNVTSLIELAGTSQAETYRYTYDPTFSNLTSITDPLGHKTTYSYDSLGNPTAMTDPLGHKTSMTVNSEGEPTSITDPLGHKVTATYTFGDLTAITDVLGRATHLFTDAAGRVTVHTDPLGNAWLTSYDNLDHVTQVTDPLGDSTTTVYDPDENVQSITDARGNTTYYTYDAVDQLCATTDPLAGISSAPTACPTSATPHTTVYEYDAGGNLVTKIDRKGQTTSSQYDPLNRPSLITYADGPTITPTYDLGNRLTQLADSVSGTIAWTYDGLNRVTAETDPQAVGSVSCNGVSVSICYSYDAAGNRTGMTVAGQSAITYTHDAANRLTSLTQGTGTVSSCNGIATSVSVCPVYDNANRQTALSFPDGVTQSSAYDNANELTGLTYAHGSTTLGSLTYGYDPAGRRATVNGSWARTNIPAAIGAETFNADNELCWTSSGASSSGCGSPPSGATSFSYDANGNLTGDGTNSYSWNARDQLASISGGVTASYGYDGLGRRTASTMGGTTTNYLLDGQNVVQELSGGAATANLLDGPYVNQYYTFSAGSAQSSLLTDALGSTVALADSTGTVQTQYTYDPFGATTTSGSASSNPMQYAGMENDGTGQYFDHARYYNPSEDRFTSQDPIGCTSSEANLYRYVVDNPVNLIDPLGLFDSCKWGGGLLFAGAGLGIAGFQLVNALSSIGAAVWFSSLEAILAGLLAGGPVGWAIGLALVGILAAAIGLGLLLFSKGC